MGVNIAAFIILRQHKKHLHLDSQAKNGKMLGRT
jgi:hypothetical protein